MIRVWAIRTLLVAVAAAGLLLGLNGARGGGEESRAASSTAQMRGRALYSPASPFNRRIPARPRIDPRSQVMVAGMTRTAAQSGLPLSIGEWTVPVYLAGPRTPRHTVSLRTAPPSWAAAYGTPRDFIAAPPGWSTDPFPWRPRLGRPATARPRAMTGVPIPAHARPDGELDAHMTIIDPVAGCEYDLYGAHRTARGWQAVWANSTRLRGSGVYPGGLSSKASGFAGAAGLIWPEELRRGRIDHTLFFAYPRSRAGGPVAPATSSDGRTGGADTIPIGARVQLDPGLDLDRLGLPRHERIIARAMQEYGMILGDTGGATGLFAVHRHSFAGDAYRGVLPRGAYTLLERIPVSRFRVLDLPAQRRGLQLNLRPSGCGRLR